MCSRLFKAVNGVRFAHDCRGIRAAREHRHRALSNSRLMSPVVDSAARDGHTTPVSERVIATDEPCIVKTQTMMEGVEGVLSLAQGVVFWSPPERAIKAASEACSTPLANSYGPAKGMPALRQALVEKLAHENKLTDVDVMVTSGANQAFVNVVLTVTDASDSVVLFTPLYFNHRMALQMTGGGRNIMYGPPNAGLKPDLDWLEEALQSKSPPRMVVIVNPSNPAGFVMTQAELQRAADLTAAAGSWLIVDNTYEHFTYDGAEHSCVGGSHVINIFSFSKAYGMMGWRVGYLAFPSAAVHPTLGDEMLKVQDTIPICPTQISQLVALESLKEGRSWVTDRVAQLAENRKIAKEALTVLPEGSLQAGEGAIYFHVKLPDGTDDEAIVERLIKEYRVTTIPGSACGTPGYIRIAYANCSTEDCREACRRLREGLLALLADAL